ncbi:hypothetical protein F5144DRAFT_402378 [Chaetomium tenue]|uniref:Uncharacterized protein n=1 Tax=Chaetomium tenue TaxID=1854479 RepID=A0ACB7NTY0_9PEZI|nr:hypothetical protein F5144DRAFT_402378 [Chaetomium globosum]
MCCCERGRCDQFLPIPVCFSSGRVFFFSSASSLPNAAPHSSGTPMSHHAASTTPPHTTQTLETPERPPFLFGKFNQTRPGWRLSLRRIQLAVSHNPFRPKIGRSRLAGLSTVLTKRTASRLVQFIAWGHLLLHSRREHVSMASARSGGPTDDSIRRVWPHPAVSTTTWVPSPPWLQVFIGIVFFLSHVFLLLPLLFLDVSSRIYPLCCCSCCCCCCLLCCIKSQLRFGMYGGDDGTERWNRFNIIGSG